jgi:hypothetical protein
MATTPAQMVGMRVRDDRAIDRAPGVNEKAPPLAVQAHLGHAEE